MTLLILRVKFRAIWQYIKFFLYLTYLTQIPVIGLYIDYTSMQYKVAENGNTELKYKYLEIVVKYCTVLRNGHLWTNIHILSW